MISSAGRPLVLVAYLRNSGYHEAAWRLSDDPGEVLRGDYYVRLATIAERGVLDAIFLPDSPGVVPFRSQYLPGAGFDPIDLLAYIAASTKHVGLIGTVSTTYSEPWDVARRLATLDFLSGGRAGWNLVTTIEPAAAANFGVDPHPPASLRYARAEEFLAVVHALWDAWSEDAAPRSAATGIWADPAAITAPAHRGEHFAVAGHLPFPRSPQGRPFVTQAGTSRQGLELAARHADAVFTAVSSIEEAAAVRTGLRAAAVAAGRRGDDVALLPGLSFTLAADERAARRLHDELESLASEEFRWRNLANLAGVDHQLVDPDAPFPFALFEGAAGTSFGAAILELAREHGGSYRSVARRLSALPGGLDVVGTPEDLARLILTWRDEGAVDGFTLMPNVLPSQLELFVDEVVPRLVAAGAMRSSYPRTTLRGRMSRSSTGSREG